MNIRSKIRFRERIKTIQNYLPVTKRFIITFSILVIMGLALIYLPSPYGMGTFSIGVLLLSTEYKVLKLISLDQVYDWIITNESLHKSVQKDYELKKFITRGPEKIEIDSITEGNFRAVVTQTSECLYPGLNFTIYVRAPVQDLDEDLCYDLRLGSAKITRVSKIDNNRRSVFFAVEEWIDEFEDEFEQEFAEDAKDQLIKKGNSEHRPFVKINKKDNINKFSIEEWSAIYEWSKHAEDKLK